MIFVLRCVQYNGCKWLGGVLRVEKAKVNYLTRLKTEWDTKPDSQEHTNKSANISELTIEEDPMRIATPASGFVKRKVCHLPCYAAVSTCHITIYLS